MPDKEHYTAQQFIDAIKGTGGIVSAIAQRIGCEWHTARRYIDKHPSVRQAYDAEFETILDLTEGALYKRATKDQEPWAVKYLLSTKGKKRGYTERVEHTGAEGGAIEHNVKPDLSGLSDAELDALATIAGRLIGDRE